MKPTLISLHGLPRSGKSALTAKLRKHLGAPVVNADSIRLALHGQRYQGLAESFVFAIRQVMVRALFLAGHDVVLYDETNYSRCARDRMKSDEWVTRYIDVDTPPDVCKDRAIATGQPDLLPVIDAMWARRDPLGEDELRYEIPEDLKDQFLKVLVACEYSGRVRDAFRAQGHDAVSCDFYPTEVDGPHYQGDVRDLLDQPWDLVIAHPDCTYHTNASVRWFTTIPKKPKPGVFYGDARWEKWAEAIDFFRLFQRLAHVPRVCIENPIPHCYSRDALGRYTQVIQPWQYGHKEMKATCLWLKGLDPLKPTRVVGPPPKDVKERRKWAKVHLASPGPLRWKERSRTYKGIARAMAAQWG